VTVASRTLWHFDAAPKASALSTRVVPVEHTERRVRAVMKRIPVTRLTDLTPLDYLGLPVYSVVTPLALDLTTHLGKGDDAQSARASALMEAVERVSAEPHAQEKTIRASFDDLQLGSVPRPANPVHFDLPADSAYTPQRAFDWLEGFDLVTASAVWLPADLAESPPREGLLRNVDTNGLASGNTRLEAVVHALCEVIERDAISQHEFRTLYGEPGDPRPPCAPIALDSIAGPARHWVERIREHGLQLLVQDITADIEVPTFRAYVVDLAYSTSQGTAPARFPGYGTHPCTQVAVLRAITEAIQSRLAAIQGARDAYNVLPNTRRSATLAERAREMSSDGAGAFDAIPSRLHADLRDDLEFILAALRRAGFDSAIAVDLTRADLGLPVVRVRVPGLATFVVNRRRLSRRVLRYLV